MKLATTTSDFRAYLKDDISKLNAFKKTNFKYLDFSFYDDAQEGSLLLSDKWQAEYKKIYKYASENGLKFVQAHSPGGNPLSFDENYKRLLESTIRSIKACKILGVQNIVVHSGVIGDVSKDEFFTRNLEFYKLLFPHMEEANVNVLIENSATANMGSNYFFFTGEQMKEFLDYAAHPLLGACWDTGHANMMPISQYDNILKLGDHLKALHIADNLGAADDHFAPFFGTVSLDEVMCALVDMGYKGYFTFESDNFPIVSKWPNNRKRYEKRQDLLKLPLEIKIEAEKLLFSIGKHILETYNVYED